MNVKKEPSLLQVLGLGTAILLVAGNMIGSGVFKKITPMSAELMDGSLILWAWVAAGLISMLGAFSFASLATTTKEAGGQFQYFKNVFGGFFGFIYGWSFFAVISTASIASIAYVFAESLGNLSGVPPILEAYSSYSIEGVIFPFQHASVKFIAISALVFLTLFNIRGVEGGDGSATLSPVPKFWEFYSSLFWGLVIAVMVQLFTQSLKYTLPIPVNGVTCCASVLFLPRCWVHFGRMMAG